MPDTDLGERSLSICIPTHHGRARTLTETLDSVARQADTVPGWTLYRGADAVQANLGLSWAYTSIVQQGRESSGLQ